MRLKYYGQEFECAKAVKGTNYIKLYDANNMEIANFAGISNFNGFELIDGEWSSPEPTPEELQAEQNIDFDYRLSLMELGI